jgi:hypothetical protein
LLVKVAKSHWQGIQSVNRVFALTLTMGLVAPSDSER